MTAGGITPAVTAWAERTVPGAQVVGAAVRPLAGGSVARWGEQLTLHLSGGHAPLELVRKEAAALEIAGLSAAQAARADDTAIPELVAYGSDWLILPFAPGGPLDRGDPVPANLFDSLAALHARYHGGADDLPAAIPRARALIGRAASLPAAAGVLASLPPTRLNSASGGRRCRSPCSTCRGEPGTGPPLTSRPRSTGSSRRWTGSPVSPS